MLKTDEPTHSLRETMLWFIQTPIEPVPTGQWVKYKFILHSLQSGPQLITSKTIPVQFLPMRHKRLAATDPRDRANYSEIESQI